jgi:2'-hydroxyisoflavone reductase
MKKNTTRREIIKLGIKTGLTLPLLGSTLSSCLPKSENNAVDSEEKKLNILILGGTSFLGPHQIAYALSRGHSISTFTRGRTVSTVHQELFDQVEELIGDRKDNLTALENRKWDAVIDNSGRDVEWTKRSAALLKDAVDIYLYTSSTGVYYPYLQNGFSEEAKVLLSEPEGITDEDIKMEYGYGVMKSNSELVAREQFGDDRTIVVRPTYMVGPADQTDRFIHWPIRLSRGGETLVPGKVDDPVQYVDVRDVAEWMIRLIEQKKTGTYNAVGPRQNQTMNGFVEEASQAFDVTSSFIKIDDYEFLKENNIPYLIPWIMPVGDNLGSATISNKKAIENGLTFRSLKDTMNDTHQWWYSNAISDKERDDYEKNPDSVLMREKSILQVWQNRS